MALWNRKHGSDESKTATVGLVVGAFEACAVYSDGEDERGRPRIIAWESIPFATPADLQAGLTAFVDRHRLQGLGCRCTLHPNDYSLRLVERPANVPDDDLNDATRWLVRDLIEFDVEDAEIATLKLPEDTRRGRTPHMFVVAAQRSPLLDLAHVIDFAGLELLGFEIVETTMLALEERLPRAYGGSAMMRFHPKSNILTIAQDDHLYLTRNIHVEFEDVESWVRYATEVPEPPQSDVLLRLEPFLREIQRSLDYYESEYRQDSVARLVLLPSSAQTSALVPALTEGLQPVEVVPFELHEFFAFSGPPPNELQLPLTLAAASTLVGRHQMGRELLPTAPRREPGNFGVSSVARIAALVLAFLGIFYGITSIRLDSESQSLAQIQSQRDELAKTLAERTAQTIQEARSSDPEQEIADLVREREALMSILRDMRARTSKRDASFSRMLGGLANQDLDSIWLERIVFSRGGAAISIEGRTIAPEEVPTYLRRLGDEPTFASRRFRTFEVEREDSDDDSLFFRLATLEESSRDDDGDDDDDSDDDDDDRYGRAEPETMRDLLLAALHLPTRRVGGDLP